MDGANPSKKYKMLIFYVYSNIIIWPRRVRRSFLLPSVYYLVVLAGLMNLNDFYKQTDYFRMIFIFTSTSFSIKYIELLSILFTYIYGVILYFSKVYSLISPEYDKVF